MQCTNNFALSLKWLTVHLPRSKQVRSAVAAARDMDAHKQLGCLASRHSALRNSVPGASSTFHRKRGRNDDRHMHLDVFG